MAIRTVPHERLRIEPGPVSRRIERFIAGTVRGHFGFDKVVVGLSGGVDSATVAVLASRALGAHNVVALRLPYLDLARADVQRAERLVETLGLPGEIIDVGPIVDAYARTRPTMDWHRRGNVQARARMLVQFDLMAELQAFPIGTGNKSESLLGYFTEHGDDAPKIEPLGDLFKTQVWQLAEHLGLPDEVIEAAPSAGLEPDQTDEGDFGMAYRTIDLVLVHMEAGCDDAEIRGLGVPQQQIDAVRARVLATHRKRLPTLFPQLQDVPADPLRYLSGASDSTG